VPVRGRDCACCLVKFFDHRNTEPIQGIGYFVIFSALVVAQERKY
jgi:hypothetical protein